MSVPSLLPVLNYNEYTLGIPYSYVASGGLNRNSPGPYYYMPKLFLNSTLAVLDGHPEREPVLSLEFQAGELFDSRQSLAQRVRMHV